MGKQRTITTNKANLRDDHDLLDDPDMIEEEGLLEPAPFDPDASITQFIDDEELMEDFIERQQLVNDSNGLTDLLEEHHSQSPELTAGDVDARWDQANMVGDEAVGGSVQTPDKDVVDEIGAAVGLVYDDDEPLHTLDKLQERDRDRWELNPASADDEETENEDEETR